MTARSWARRPRLVAGNWKMNKTAPEGAALARELRTLWSGGPPCEVALCPPFTALESVAEVVRGSRIHLGAQDLHREARGPFTGEISGPMLTALGCRFVIVGHSERRHGMGEDDEAVAHKLRAALRDGLTPILCVGETLAEREGGRTAEVLVRQLRAAFEGWTPADARLTVLAYEPVWAIGTGRVASPDQILEAHRILRATLDRVLTGGIGADVAILYGGSVSPDNARALFVLEEIDGALVGGASLEAAAFWKIAAAAGIDGAGPR